MNTTQSELRSLLERDDGLPRVVFTIPVKTRSVLNGATGNSRVAAILRSRERASQRETARVHTILALHRASMARAEIVPCVVTLTRASAGVLDTDNLAASQKGVRDGIADALGIVDGGRFATWRYEQEKSPRGTFGVRVRIERAP